MPYHVTCIGEGYEPRRHHHYHIAVHGIGRSADLVAQPKLGVRPKRWIGIDPGLCTRAAAVGSDLDPMFAR